MEDKIVLNLKIEKVTIYCCYELYFNRKVPIGIAAMTTSFLGLCHD